MDRVVSTRKFDRAVKSMTTHASLFVAERGWDVVAADYPLLSVVFKHPRSHRKIEFRFNCEDWDELPPSLALHHPASGKEIPWEQWPQGVWSVLECHPLTRKPFLCLRGIREYHSHNRHLGDMWENYRPLSSYGLLSIIDRVQQRFNDSNG